MIRQCQQCQERYEGQPLPTDAFERTAQRLTKEHLCPPCRTERFAADRAEFMEKEAQYAKSAAESRAMRWKAFLTGNNAGAMIENDEAQLRGVTEFHQAHAWQYGPKGLILIGPTGTCKTRTAFSLLRREYMAGRSVGYLNASTLATRLAAASHRYYGGDGELLELWESVDLLLIDDLGKGGIGDRHEAAMFGLVDARAMAGRPIITTQNAGSKALTEAMAPDRAEPFIRRLKEFNTVIKFS